VSSARFIVFEGADGVGKSTQTARLADRLGAVATREPGGTAIGRQIRALLLDPASERLDDRAEALLMAADRAQHIAEIVRPALAEGRHVVSDRFAYSSIAYQGHGRGLDVGWLTELSRWAAGDLAPDVVLLLDGPSRRELPADRLEQTDDGFRQRVAASYEIQAQAAPDLWVRVDADAPVEVVASRIEAELVARFGPALFSPARADS